MTTSTIQRSGRLLAVATALVLAASACGDDGADAADSTDTALAGVTGAIVTIGDETFELPQELVCIALGGAVSGTFTDGSGVEVSIDVPPEDWETSSTGDWEPPSLTLRDERDEMDWRIYEAGPQLEGLYPGSDADGARITAFTVDGSSADGTGAVIDTFGISQAAATGEAEPGTVPVRFEFGCA